MMHSNSIHIIYHVHNEPESLSESQRAAIEAAFLATNSAYAPYSGFSVGASLVLEDGTIISASNQENASYPCGVCAERNVLYYYGANYRNVKILKLAVGTKILNPTLKYPPAPCGLCRQVLVEYERNNPSSIEILLGQPDKTILVFNSCQDLLPFGFYSDFLVDT